MSLLCTKTCFQDVLFNPMFCGMCDCLVYKMCYSMYPFLMCEYLLQDVGKGMGGGGEGGTQVESC